MQPKIRYHTSGAGIAYPPGAQSSPPMFSGVRVAQSLVFVVFCRSLFFFFLFVIVLSVRRLTVSIYPFGIIKLSLLLHIPVNNISFNIYNSSKMSVQYSINFALKKKKNVLFTMQ